MRRWLFLVPIVCAALWLRTNDLASRPMHADEANQAVKFGELLETGRYAFDPRDHHGPVLYYAALPIAWLRGQRSLASLDEVTVRLLPAIAGTASVALLFWLALPLGVWPAAAAAAFLALSPPAVYYARYFVQETMLGTFTLGLFVCARAWWQSGAIGWAVATGVCAGLMQSSKASAPTFVFAAVAATLLCQRKGEAVPVGRFSPRSIALILLGAIGTAALFYSSFGTHLAGLADAFNTYRLTAERLGSGATGHEKPWWYYVRLCLWHRDGGLVFEQIAFSLLAFAGFFAAWFSKETVIRWAAIYATLVFVFLSIPAYKTPWHVIHLVPAFALLAAGALQALTSIYIHRSFGVSVAFACANVTFILLARQTALTVFLRPADARNPYAYVHSSPDVKKFRPLADAAHARAPNQPIRVISEEYWPIPWYLRGLEKSVGYWPVPPADCDGALVIASEHQAAAVRARLRGTYEESILGLRPGFIMVVFSPKP